MAEDCVLGTTNTTNHRVATVDSPMSKDTVATPLDHIVMRMQGVWCCDKQHKCTWQGFALHQGLAWGVIPSEHNVWRQRHEIECGGNLIQLAEPHSA